jgi:hypothetical protein
LRRYLFILLLGLGALLARPHSAGADPALWPRALELMAAGQTDAALPLLEALVSDAPDNKAYRFELAKALFLLERDFRAKWHLEQVRGASLTAAEQQVVSQVLAQIAARSVWSASFSFALKPESNASRKTSSDSVSLGGLDFSLTPESRAKPGVSALITAGLGYSPQINDKWRGRFSLNTHLRHNKDAFLRDYQLTARAGAQYLHSPRSSVAAGVQQGFRWVADRKYSSSSGIWAEHTRLAGDRGKWDFAVDLSQIRHDGALPDARRAFVLASYGHAVSGNALVTVTGYHEEIRGTLPNLAGTRSGLSVSGLYAWKGGLMTALQLGYQTDGRRGPEPLFGQVRQDRTRSVSMSVYHRDFRLGSLSPTLVIGVEENRSNIPLARFDNEYMTVGFTRNF